MTYDKSRVYTALNADELKVGSKVIVANCLNLLKAEVEAKAYPTYVYELSGVMGTTSTNRFKVGNDFYSLAYLVSEPEEKKLKWTDLKIGDVVRSKDAKYCYMVTGYDPSENALNHVFFGGDWYSNNELTDWEKVE